MARKTLTTPKQPKTRRFAQELPVRLSADEYEKRAEKLAVTITEKDALLEKKKLAAKDYTDRIMIKAREQEALRKAVETHSEERMVECEEVSDFEQNRLVVKRLDTGEIVTERALDSVERDRLAQGDFLTDAPSTNGLDPHPEA